MTVPDPRRVLTVRQPWASLLMLPDGWRKDVENRTKPVPSTIPQAPLPQFPFRLWIHSAGRTTMGDWKRADGIDHKAVLAAHLEAGAPFGALLGSVVVTDCHHANTCEHICPEAGCDDCDDAHGRCGHDASWPSAPGSDPSDDAPPARCDLTGLACMNLCSPWAEHDVWHIVTADPQPLPGPIPMKGRLGWWRLPEGVPA